jgi:hypothetical protein
MFLSPKKQDVSFELNCSTVLPVVDGLIKIKGLVLHFEIRKKNISAIPV